MTQHILQRIPVVAGLGHIERARRIQGPFTATLAAEKDNRYFLHAIAVLWQGEKVGYVAPEIARHYYEPLIAWTGEPPSCPGRRASVSDHETSGVEHLLDFSSLSVSPTD
jgi:hypothetical protein